MFWKKQFLELKGNAPKSTGCAEPRRASETKTMLFVSESECIAGRDTERHIIMGLNETCCNNHCK